MLNNASSYPLDPPPVSKAETSKGEERDRTSLVSHPSASNGTLILGHTSLLTTFLLSPDEKYIITADRDEHIRVSWYPQGYCIETFCLGSTKLVPFFLVFVYSHQIKQIRFCTSHTKI